MRNQIWKLAALPMFLLLTGATVTWNAFEEGSMANCTNLAINSAVTCGGTRGIRSEGYNALTLEFYYDRGAGTGWTTYLEVCSEGQASTDCTDDADWAIYAVQDATAGVITLTPGLFTRLISADDNLAWSTTVNFKRFRLKGMVATGAPDANDKMRVRYRLNLLPAF